MTIKVFTLSLLSFCMYAQAHAQDSTQISNENTQHVLTESEMDPNKLYLLKNIKGEVRPEGKGWYMEVAAGYGIPFLPTNRRSPLPEIGDKYWYQQKGELSVKPLYGTNGGGGAVDVTVGHMFNKNIGIDGTITIAHHPERLDAKIDIKGYTASQRTYTTALYFAPHLVMKARKGKFGVTSKAGLFIPFYGNTVSLAQIHDRNGRMTESMTGGLLMPVYGIMDLTYKAKAHTAYNPTIGVSTSIAFDYFVNDRVSVFARARVGAYTISLKETTMKELDLNLKILGMEIDQMGPLKTQIRNPDEAPEFLKKIVYKKEITNESNTARYGKKADMNKPMEEPGVRFNASSLYFNVGVSINFN